MRLDNNLNYEFIAKYNKLYFEVAEYYGITSLVRQSNVPSRKWIDYIVISELGIEKDYSTTVAMDFLKKKYPYLLPFYTLYHHICDGDDFDKSIFDEINNTIKTIRNKK